MSKLCGICSEILRKGDFIIDLIKFNGTIGIFNESLLHPQIKYYRMKARENFIHLSCFNNIFKNMDVLEINNASTRSFIPDGFLTEFMEELP